MINCPSLMTQDGFCWVPILDADSQLSNFGIVEDQYQYPDLVRPPNMNKGVYGIRISKVKHHVSYIYILPQWSLKGLHPAPFWSRGMSAAFDSHLLRYVRSAVPILPGMVVSHGPDNHSSETKCVVVG